MCLGKWELTHLGGMQYVHPTFLYESIVDFSIFFILMKLSKNRKFSGQIVYLYFIIYSFARFFIEGLRTDSLMLGEFRISQILSAGIFIVFIILAIFSEISLKKSNIRKALKINNINDK